MPAGRVWRGFVCARSIPELHDDNRRQGRLPAIGQRGHQSDLNAGRERRRGFDLAVDAMPSAGGCGCVVEIELLVLLSKALVPPRVSHM